MDQFFDYAEVQDVSIADVMDKFRSKLTTYNLKDIDDRALPAYLYKVIKYLIVADKEWYLSLGGCAVVGKAIPNHFAMSFGQGPRIQGVAGLDDALFEHSGLVIIPFSPNGKLIRGESVLATIGVHIPAYERRVGSVKFSVYGSNVVAAYLFGQRIKLHDGAGHALSSNALFHESKPNSSMYYPQYSTWNMPEPLKQIGLNKFFTRVQAKANQPIYDTLINLEGLV